MDQPLPPAAEAWLRALAHELWPLASDERESVLAELRGHLFERAAAGLLDEALKSLGTPQALAAAYDVPGAAGTIATVPEAVGAGRGKSVRMLMSDTHATLRASRNGLPLVGALLVTSLTATNFLLWLDMRLPWVGVQFAPVMAFRIAAVLLALSAAYRLVLSRTERPWSVDRGFLAFSGALALATFAIVLAALSAGRAAGAITHGSAAADPIRRMAALIVLVLGSMALLRIQPWLAALASRRKDCGLRATWRGTRGRMTTIVGAWAILVLPLYLLHALISVLATHLLPLGGNAARLDLIVCTLLGLAALDAIACTIVVTVAVMLNAASFRWVAGERIPPPSPFATGKGEPELVDAARAQLERLVRPRPQPERAA